MKVTKLTSVVEMDIEVLRAYIYEAYAEGFHMRRDAEEKKLGGGISLADTLHEEQKKYVNNEIKELLLHTLV